MTWLQLLPVAMLPESNAPFAVTVCGTTSLFCHTTLSPRLTVSVSGLFFMPSMVTVCVAAAARPGSAQAAARPAASSSLCAPLFMSLPQVGLQVLGVVQVGLDRGAHLLDQALEFGVLGRGDQGLVDR